MADKRVQAVALDLGGDDGWDASSQLAVLGDERAWVASRLGVRRGERVLRRDLEVGRELVRVGPSGERRVLRSGESFGASSFVSHQLTIQVLHPI